MSTKHLFILNPAAGKHNTVPEMTAAIENAFAADPRLKDEKFEIRVTSAAGDATAIIRRAADENESLRVYSCGGDGTLNEAVSGAAERENVAVCPIPVGSGNDFIKYFDNLNQKNFMDISACVLGTAAPCDLLRVNEHWCLNIASVGLDAITAARQQKVKRFPLISGAFAYKIALGFSFLSSMKNAIEVEVDGEKANVGGGHITIAAAGNGRWYGGGFKATPLADIRDGLIDFIAIPTMSRLQFLKYVGDYQKGNHMETMKQYLFYRRCRLIRLFSPKPVIVQADGEIFSIRDPEIRVVPRALNLILPCSAKG